MLAEDMSDHTLDNMLCHKVHAMVNLGGTTCLAMTRAIVQATVIRTKSREVGSIKEKRETLINGRRFVTAALSCMGGSIA